MKNRPKEISIAFHEKAINQKEDISKHFDTVWHFHNSYEIVHIKKGKGFIFLGDEEFQFKDGDLFFLGILLPHMWLNDKAYFNHDSNLSVHSQVIHFRKELFPSSFLSMEEHSDLDYLLKSSQKGIVVKNETRNKVIDLMQKMNEEDGMHKTITLFSILNLLAKSTRIEMLSKGSYQEVNNPKQLKRLNKINNYIFSHYKEDISLDKISNYVGMNKSAFCRYFKLYMNRPFNVYLNEFRIHNAKKLIRNNDMPITEVCFESGFNNIANFNRRFKMITSHTPLQYRDICSERE